MRNIFPTVIIAVTALVAVSCAKLPLYQSKSINSKDEISDMRYYDKKSRISYDIYNDENNIYVNIKTSDYYSQIKILKMGLTLWFDQEAKKNKNKGIVFPLKHEFKPNMQTMSMQSANSLNSGVRSISELHNQFQLSDKSIELIGMEQEIFNREITTVQEEINITATITFDSLNRLVYLAVIPIKKVFTDKNYDNKTYSVGIESGFLDMNSNGMRQGMQSGGGHSGQMGMSGGMKGGGGRSGGMGGGQRSGGIQGGNQEQRSALSEPIKIWFSVSLTDN